MARGSSPDPSTGDETDPVECSPVREQPSEVLAGLILSLIVGYLLLAALIEVGSLL